MDIKNEQHATHIRTSICECTLLRKCSWDFEIWYQAALRLFAEVFSSKESEWLRVCLWYAMTESILHQLPAPSDTAICECVLKDLKEKLGETQIDAELISRQVASRSSLYQQVVAEYGFDCGITSMGYHWTNWQRAHSQAEMLELSKQALPFWVFHAPYAARFAECWAAYHHAVQQHPCIGPALPNEFSLEDLLQTANYLARHPRKPICDLLASPTVSGGKCGYCTDREALFFSLTKSGVPYMRARAIAELNSHQADYGPKILTVLSSLPLERSAHRVLASGFYLPPRARAARKVLQLVELY